MAQAVGLNCSTVGRCDFVVISFFFVGFRFMAVRAPFVVVEAVGADLRLTPVARFKTAPAAVVAACRARPHAVRAARVITAAANSFTFAANRVTTLLAGVAFVFTDCRAAIGTAAPVPECQFDIGAFGVVGAKYATDEHEEVQQAALGQCLPDGVTSFAFTKDLIHHVWMGHVFSALGRMRFPGDYAIPEDFVASRTRPLKPELKPAQTDSGQINRLGNDGEPIVSTVKVELVELLTKRDQILIDVMRRRSACKRRGTR